MWKESNHITRTANLIPVDYLELLESIKNQIRFSQSRAVLAVNRELILLYWNIGKEILKRQASQGWGSKIVEKLAHDLRSSFPEMKGFSPRNVSYMRSLAEFYPDEHFVQQLVAQIPWGHNIIILQNVKHIEQQEFYIRKTIENAWSRAILVLQIESDLFHRQGRAITNFDTTLPSPQSDLAQQTLKDPYIFDFLSLSERSQERDLEQGLLDHIQRFLLELGLGFSFVGRQVCLDVADQEYFIDLLFYHLKLRCYIVIELKAEEFLPEFAGKMNFYLSAVDAQFKQPEDKPSIGLLLCRTKNRLIVEYALRGINNPMGVAQWETRALKRLPKELKGKLPTVKELEEELSMQK